MLAQHLQMSYDPLQIPMYIRMGKLTPWSLLLAAIEYLFCINIRSLCGCCRIDQAEQRPRGYSRREMEAGGLTNINLQNILLT